MVIYGVLAKNLSFNCNVTLISLKQGGASIWKHQTTAPHSNQA